MPYSTSSDSDEDYLPPALLARGDQNILSNKDTADTPSHPTRENNCLFDAIIASMNLISSSDLRPADSLVLRNMCNEALDRDGFPKFEDGTPAGEQYLQVLSLILMRKIKVYDGSGDFISDIVHHTISNFKSLDRCAIKIKHQGDPSSGHWTEM